MGKDKKIDYKALYQDIINGDAVLFVGAGFCCGNRSMNGEFKTGTGLANYLCEEAKIRATNNLNIACSRFITSFSDSDEGVDRLIAILKREFTAKTVADTHKWLLSLPWKRIYTTNYDNLIEKASKELKIRRQTIDILSRPEPSAVTDTIIHTNGYIESVEAGMGEAAFQEKFRITHESYFRNAFLDSNWKSLFMDDLCESKKVVFLGYSLDYDFDLQTLIVEDAMNKCVFVDYANGDIDPDKEYRFEALGVSTFAGAAAFSDALKVYEGSVFRTNSQELKSFCRVTPEKYPRCDKSEITAADAFSFYVMGRLDDKYINADNSIVIKREKKLKEARKLLEQSGVNTLIIHSKLGNGKSVFKHCLMFSLCEEYPVYELRSTSGLYDEISIIEKEAEAYDRFYIVVDNFSEYMNKIDTLYKGFSDKARFVLLVRTPIKDNLCNQLYKKGVVSAEQLEEISLDLLEDSELHEIYNALRSFGYWGNVSSTKEEENIRYYKTVCKGTFSGVSYFILNSKDIRKKIDSIVEEINKRAEVRDYIIADSILTKVNINVTNLQIIQLLEIDHRRFDRMRRSPDLVQVFDQRTRNNQDISIASPIFAEYLLEKYSYKHILDVTARIYNNSSKLVSKDVKYSIHKNLVSRSNIRLITKTEGADVDVCAVQLYDSLRLSPVSTNNPFYWMQYAICKLNQMELNDAGRYFENSYKVSKDFFEEPDYSHLNTHYARYMMELELQKNLISDFNFKNFAEADKKLFVDNNNSGSNLKYCLRQIEYYKKVYEKFIRNSENADWALKFNGMMERIINKAIEYLDRRSVEKYEVERDSKGCIRRMLPCFAEHCKPTLVDELSALIKNAK